MNRKTLVGVTDELHRRLKTQARNLLFEYRLVGDKRVPVDAVERLMRLYGYLIAKLIFEDQQKATAPKEEKNFAQIEITSDMEKAIRDSVQKGSGLLKINADGTFKYLSHEELLELGKTPR